MSYFSLELLRNYPNRSVDRIEIGEGKRGPITESIQNVFFGLFTGESDDKWDWLTSVE